MRWLVVGPGRPALIAGAVAAIVVAPNLLLEPASTDLAAQTFRADLWGEHGWVLWNEAWYSGHLVPGYSLLYPPLGALLGPRLVAAIAAIVAAAGFAALARVHRSDRAASLASVWFALGAGALIYTGRITFMVGLAFALLALLAAPRRWSAGALAVLAALASPLAGLFAAMAGAAMVVAGRTREGLVLAAAAGGATLALVLAFPVGGTQPFPFSSFWWVAIACAIAIALIPAELRTLRIGAAIYLTLVVALYVVPTPVGTNAPRLGALLMGPVAVLVLFERRPRLLTLVALPLLYWQLAAPIGDLLRAEGDPSTRASFYAPLLGQLDRRAGGSPVRVEVPPTQERWESVYVAERYPLARGWLRQLESTDNDVFTDDRLTPAAYRDWLTDHGVSYVALPSAKLDYISEDERDLLEGGELPFLREVWSDSDWRLWEVLPPGGGPFVPGGALADRGARITALGPDGFTAAAPGPGSYLLRMRYTPYLRVASGDACIEDAGGDSMRFVVAPVSAGEPPGPAPGSFAVEARLSIDGLLGVKRSCSG